MRNIKNLNLDTYILKRAMIFIALFIFLPYSFVFCTPQLLSDIENNCLWVKHNSISDSSKVDSLINFIVENKVNKILNHCCLLIGLK